MPSVTDSNASQSQLQVDDDDSGAAQQRTHQDSTAIRTIDAGAAQGTATPPRRDPQPHESQNRATEGAGGSHMLPPAPIRATAIGHRPAAEAHRRQRELLRQQIAQAQAQLAAIEPDDDAQPPVQFRINKTRDASDQPRSRHATIEVDDDTPAPAQPRATTLQTQQLPALPPTTPLSIGARMVARLAAMPEDTQIPIHPHMQPIPPPMRMVPATMERNGRDERMDALLDAVTQRVIPQMPEMQTAGLARRMHDLIGSHTSIQVSRELCGHLPRMLYHEQYILKRTASELHKDPTTRAWIDALINDPAGGFFENLDTNAKQLVTPAYWHVLSRLAAAFFAANAGYSAMPQQQKLMDAAITITDPVTCMNAAAVVEAAKMAKSQASLNNELANFMQRAGFKRPRASSVPTATSPPRPPLRSPCWNCGNTGHNAKDCRAAPLPADQQAKLREQCKQGHFLRQS